jgi:hypothetical protein
MIKNFILLVLVVMMFTGCSKTVTYKYDEAISQNGDWSVNKGHISIKDSKGTIKFNVKYNDDTLIKEGESWYCEVLVCKNNIESSIDEAEVIFTRHDIYGKEIAEGDTKAVDTDENTIDIDNDYNFSTVYLRIEYTKGDEFYEDYIELSLRS